MSDRPLVVFGGTFDPVHLGHLRAAWEAAETLDATVLMMPARVPPHRPPTVASAEQRADMMAVALQGQSRLVLDTRELRREGPSYTVETLIELRAEVGANRPLVLLVGADAFAGLHRWHRWRELFDLAHIGVLSRPGVPASLGPEMTRELAVRRADTVAGLLHKPCGGVLQLNVTGLDVAANAVRALLRDGREPRYLMPETLLASPHLLSVYMADRSIS